MKQLHIEILNEGKDAWNAWRKQPLNTSPDLSKEIISQTQPAFRTVKTDYFPKEFSDYNFQNTDFSESLIRGAKFQNCIFENCNFYKTDLRKATFRNCDLTKCKFHIANLTLVNFEHCDFREALLWETVIARTTFSKNVNLHLVKHAGPSIIDHRTFQKSLELPIEFLRGVGLTDDLIEFYRSKFRNNSKGSCFISHSSKDKEFVVRLYNSLQELGFRCWYAPKALNYGDKIRDEIEDAIIEYEKLVIVLSTNSVESYWVEDEVEAAIEQERGTNKSKLIPIMLDKSVLALNRPWLNKIKRSRHIGDFSEWLNESNYQNALVELTVALMK